MTVQKTERRLPPGMSPSGFGQAVTDGDYVLISYLTNIIPHRSFNEYVIFALNDAPADIYRWTFTNKATGEVLMREDTSTGIQLFEANTLGEIEIRVEVVEAPLITNPAATFLLTQTVLPRRGALEALLTADGASRADPQASREIVNELREYIFEAAYATGLNGIPPRLLAAIVYKEILDRPKEPTGWSSETPIPIPRILYPDELIRRRELFLAAEEVNNPNGVNLISIQEDNSLGVCQMKPQTLAMLLGKTPWLEIPKGKLKKIDKQVEDNWGALSDEDKIDLYNVLRFPKSNIFYTAQMLAKLKNRPHRWPDLTADQLLLPANELALKVIAGEYNYGPSSSARDKVTFEKEYGPVKIPRIFKMSVLQHFFGKPKVTAELRNIDDEVLEYLSADEHSYFSRNTRIHGTFTVEGEVGDKVTAVELEVLQEKSVVAKAQLAESARSLLLKEFDVTGKVAITSSQLLFEMPGVMTLGVRKTFDSELMLRINLHTLFGLIASVGYGPVQLLVLLRGLVRISRPGDPDPRDSALGGDDWVLPNVKKVLDDFPDLRIGDISKMNGGTFKNHSGHRGGEDVEAHFDGYDNRDAAAARKMLTYLNDTLHGFKIRQIYVTYKQQDSDPFWTEIKHVTLIDGRKAADVISPLENCESSFQMRIRA